MRRLLRAGSSAVLIAACSTSNTADDGGAAVVDAAAGPQPIGAPCDPAIAQPCLPTGDLCLGVRCEPIARTCTEYLTDAGPGCGDTASCSSTADCDVGLTCGYPIGGGCADGGAKGTCIDPPLLCEDDASACGPGGTTCDCSGRLVPILAAGYAAAPTPTGGECPADAAVMMERGPD